MTIFNTTITNIGAEAEMFQAEKMIILFGENAPESLADYCYNIQLNKASEEITTEMTLTIADTAYSITAVGSVVTKNLNELGHITIKFDGSTEAELPGTLYVEAKEMPEITVGSTITI